MRQVVSVLRKQAGRSRLQINDLRNDPISFAQLPKLDALGSSPITRRVSQAFVQSQQPNAPGAHRGFLSNQRLVACTSMTAGKRQSCQLTIPARGLRRRPAD